MNLRVLLVVLFIYFLFGLLLLLFLNYIKILKHSSGHVKFVRLWLLLFLGSNVGCDLGYCMSTYTVDLAIGWCQCHQ